MHNICSSRCFANKVGTLFKKKRCSFSRPHRYSSDLIFGEEVSRAKDRGLPILALESTIITHGMPYPDNLNTALEVEDVIRLKNVVPATIAILNGKIKVGVTPGEIEELSRKNSGAIKVSRRDFSYALSRGLTGGTTVSGTMLVADKAGIGIMATGGIGGVHREFDSSMDASADLEELGKTPVAVVCSGVKAILDISKTLEYLETQGVPVVTLGETANFPAFYCRRTLDPKLESPMRVSSPEEAAALVFAQRQLGFKTGILLAVPIPEEHSLDPREVESAIEEALRSAKRLDVKGKAVTPFLLDKLSALTRGSSLEANKALIKNNAAVAAEIALHLHSKSSKRTTRRRRSSGPVVIGGATCDTILRVDSEVQFNGSTHKGQSRKSYGGVGRNLANALVNLGISETKLISVVGDDEAGEALVRTLGSAGRATIKKLPGLRTANYTALVDGKGSCRFGVGEMEAFDKIDVELLENNLDALREARIVVVDGNPPMEAMRLALNLSGEGDIPVWYEPTDVHKALKIFQCQDGRAKKSVKFASPNLNELWTIARYFEVTTRVVDPEPRAIERVAEQLVKLEVVPVLITSLGARGVLVTRRSSSGLEPFLDERNELVETGDEVESRFYPSLELEGRDVKSVSGCGDCLSAGVVAGILRGWTESSSVSLGLAAARESLFHFETVPDSLKSLPTTQDHYSNGEFIANSKIN